MLICCGATRRSRRHQSVRLKFENLFYVKATSPSQRDIKRGNDVAFQLETRNYYSRKIGISEKSKNREDTVQRLGFSFFLVDFLGLVGIRLRNSKGRTTGLGNGGIVFSTDKSGMSLDEDEDGEDGGTNNGTSHHNKGGLVVQLTETHSKADGTRVSSSSDNTGDRSSVWWVNVWYNTIRGTFSGLDKEGEKDHNNNGSCKSSRVGEHQNEDTFGQKENGLGPEASTHSALGVGPVRDETTKTTGKEIHPTEDGCDGGGGLSRLSKLVLEVEGSGVVHGQLNTEAASVLKEEDPSVDIHGSVTEGGSSRDFCHGTVLLHFVVVSLGSIVGDTVHDNTRGESDNGRNDADSTPCLLSISTVDRLEKGEESRTHDELGDSSSEVTPSSAECVSSSNDFLGEHTAGPVLAHDEGTTGDTDEETDYSKAGGRVNDTSQGGGDGGEAKNDHEEDTGTVLVAEGTQEETHEDGSTDSEDGGCPNLLLVEADSVTDLGQEWSDGEPDEEGDEEPPPRAVKGSHVWTGKAAKLNFLGTVILIRIDLDGIGLVFLPLSLLSSSEE